jgi:hypothetical protein
MSYNRKYRKTIVVTNKKNMQNIITLLMIGLLIDPYVGFLTLVFYILGTDTDDDDLCPH